MSLWPDLLSLVCPSISSFQLQFLLPDFFHVLWFHFLREYDQPDLLLRTTLVWWPAASLQIGGRSVRYYSLSQLRSGVSWSPQDFLFERAEDSLLQKGTLVITGIWKLCPTGNVMVHSRAVFLHQSPDGLIKTQLAAPLSQNF